MDSPLPYLLLLAACLVIAALSFIALRLHARLRSLRELPPTQHPSHAATTQAEAIAAERERIYSDLHDDIGAKLLGLIHSAPNPLQADSARAILQDLRDVVTRSRGTPGTGRRTRRCSPRSSRCSPAARSGPRARRRRSVRR